MNEAGYSTDIFVRAMVIFLSSSGCRITSNALRLYSGNSSKKTDLCYLHNPVNINQINTKTKSFFALDFFIFVILSYYFEPLFYLSQPKSAAKIQKNLTYTKFNTLILCQICILSDLEVYFVPNSHIIIMSERALIAFETFSVR